MKQRFRKLAAIGMAAAITMTMGTAQPPMRSQAAKRALIQHAEVHDPSITYCEEDGCYYIFGSHQAVSRSRDLTSWEDTGSPLYRRDASEELVESFAWAGYRDGSTNAKDGMALWASCVIYNPYYEKKGGGKGSYMIYYPASSNYKRGCIGFATSDHIAKGYRYADTIMYSGFTEIGGKDETGCVETVDTNYERTNLKKLIDEGTLSFNKDWVTKDGGYNISSFPQAIDPTVFFDADENLWMVYGSRGGGIWLLPLDRATGEPKFLSSNEVKVAKDAGQNADAYFGYQLASEGEGPYILYDKAAGSYILTVTYGQITDGYNQRLFKSDKVTGGYTDCAGNNAVYQGEPHVQDALGIKLMGNYSFQNTRPYQCGGHNSLIDVDGQLYNIYHQRFADSSSYSDRVHQVFRNEKGWYCMAPYEYAGDTFRENGYDRAELVGSYQFVNHGSLSGSAQLTTYHIKLNGDGTITGALDGTWTCQDGKSYMSLTINGITYDGVFFKQQDESGRKHAVMTFSAVGTNNECVWGSRYDKEPKTAKLDDSTENPVYSFDFGVTDNYMVSNSGTAAVAAILSGKASVADDEEMGASLLCKDDDSCLKLSGDAFSGVTKGFSLAFWAKADTNPDTAVLFSASSGNSLLELRADGALSMRSGGEQADTVTLDGNFDLSEWSYVGLSIDTENALLYVNGKAVASAKMDGCSDLLQVMANTPPGLQANYFARGSVAMDNIEVYAAALSEEDFNHKYDINYAWESDWKIDFGPKGSPQWESYTMMYDTTTYNKAGGVTQSYGFTHNIDAHESSTGGNKIRDFVYKAGGEKYTFKIDLPNGTYSVFVYSGNKESDNTLNFYFNNDADKVYTQTTPEGVGSDNYDGENTYETYVNTRTLSITFWGDEKLGADAVTGALNSLEIKKVSDEFPAPKEEAVSEAAVNGDQAVQDENEIPWLTLVVIAIIVGATIAVLGVLGRKKGGD